MEAKGYVERRSIMLEHNVFEHEDPAVWKKAVN